MLGYKAFKLLLAKYKRISKRKRFASKKQRRAHNRKLQKMRAVIQRARPSITDKKVVCGRIRNPLKNKPYEWPTLFVTTYKDYRHTCRWETRRYNFLVAAIGDFMV